MRAAMTFLDQIAFSTTAIALLVLPAVVVWAVLSIVLSLTGHQLLRAAWHVSCP
jgi:hypothetical protein